MSVAEKVAKRVKRIPRGHLFSARECQQLGSLAAVQKALSRLAQSGEIERVSRGVYSRPKARKTASPIVVLPSAVTLAKYWAKMNGYTLVTQAEEAAFRLGLQTQMPMRAIFWSNGPSRRFKQGNDIVEVRHVVDSKLRWAGQPEGEIYRGLLVTEPFSISYDDWLRICGRLSINNERAKVFLQRILKISLPIGWREKLQGLDQN
ncbi:DUF6088 family protein [Saccharospirillum mangrovi]|uniref:DUF6088 family protein n=1 Tax=Saccharospirillum mangrovi TaxID=2161747 RepID=UPI000D37D7B5|nr:DUF6088 family protein [Saccharospirillum mangrovi]